MRAAVMNEIFKAAVMRAAVMKTAVMRVAVMRTLAVRPPSDGHYSTHIIFLIINIG